MKTLYPLSSLSYEQDQLRQRDSLVSMYQEQCIQLNEKAAKYKEQVDTSRKMFRVRHYLFWLYHIMGNESKKENVLISWQKGSTCPSERFLYHTACKYKCWTCMSSM
jgi:hypothetical protein